MKDIIMNSAVRKISQEFSKLRVRTRLGSNNSDVDTETSSESVYYPGESTSTSKWSPFRRKTKLTVEKANEAWGASGLDLRRRHSRNYDDEDIEVAERKRSVNSLRPSLGRHARSDLGTYPKLRIIPTAEPDQTSIKKPRKTKLKRHKSFTSTLKATLTLSNENEKQDREPKPRRKLERSKSFSGFFGNKNKAEDVKEPLEIQIKLENNKSVGSEKDFIPGSSVTRSVSVDGARKPMCISVLPSNLSSCREPATIALNNNSNSLTKKSSSAGNLNAKYNAVNQAVPRMNLTIYRSNSFNGRLSIYDALGQRLSMVETDLCSTEL